MRFSLSAVFVASALACSAQTNRISVPKDLYDTTNSLGMVQRALKTGKRELSELKTQSRLAEKAGKSPDKEKYRAAYDAKLAELSKLEQKEAGLLLRETEIRARIKRTGR